MTNKPDTDSYQLWVKDRYRLLQCGCIGKQSMILLRFSLDIDINSTATYVETLVGNAEKSLHAVILCFVSPCVRRDVWVMCWERQTLRRRSQQLSRFGQDSLDLLPHTWSWNLMIKMEGSLLIISTKVHSPAQLNNVSRSGKLKGCHPFIIHHSLLVLSLACLSFRSVYAWLCPQELNTLRSSMQTCKHWLKYRKKRNHGTRREKPLGKECNLTEKTKKEKPWRHKQKN